MSEKDLADATIDLPTLASAEALAVVPGYTLIRMRDETAVSRTYECRSERSGEFVLVHVLAKDIAADNARKNRALRDNRLIMALRAHKNLQRVLEVGEGPAGPYIIVEQPTAVALSSQLEEQGRLSVLDGLTAVRDAAAALEAAHGAGVIHRDVTPHRMLVAQDGALKLAGFGIATPVEADGAPAGLVGTPEVLAPELIKGSPPDARSDIYALGATLFWLLTGKPIFAGSAAEVLAAQQKKPVPSISSLVPEAGITIVDILYRLLQKEPARRPQTAQEVVALLDNAIGRVQRESGSPAPATIVDFKPAPSSSAYAAPPKAPAPAPKGASRTEMAVAPPTGSSPFDAASTEGDPYVGQPTGVMGSLKQMSVTEILQTLEIGKKSARVDVQSVDGDKGTMHVHDGNIVHASTPSIVGEPAVAHLIKKKEGFFRIHYEKEPCEKNISRPTQFVLLEAMRLMDEAASAPPAPAPAAAPQRLPAPSVTQTTMDNLPPARVPGGSRPAMTPIKDAVVVRRPPAERPALARPMDANEAGAFADVTHDEARVPGAAAQLGDGIERDGGDDAAPRARRGVEDATVPSVPTRGSRARAIALQTWRSTSAASAQAYAVTRTQLGAWAQLVRQRAPVLEADLEERFAPLRPSLGKVHPRLATLPLWQLAVAVLTALVSVAILIAAL